MKKNLLQIVQINFIQSRNVSVPGIFDFFPIEIFQFHIKSIIGMISYHFCMNCRIEHYLFWDATDIYLKKIQKIFNSNPEISYYFLFLKLLSL